MERETSSDVFAVDLLCTYAGCSSVRIAFIFRDIPSFQPFHAPYLYTVGLEQYNQN